MFKDENKSIDLAVHYLFFCFVFLSLKCWTQKYDEFSSKIVNLKKKYCFIEDLILPKPKHIPESFSSRQN